MMLQGLLKSVYSRCVAGALVIALAGAAHAGDIQSLDVSRSADYTRVVISVSDRPEYSMFVLENPHRVVIDISGSRMQASLRNLDLDDGPVAAVRSGVRNGTDTRIVLDLKSPVNPSSLVLPPNADSGERLVIDLYDIDRQAPALAPAVAETAPEVSQPAPSNSSRRNIVVAIDAGHGGTDPGA